MNKVNFYAVKNRPNTAQFQQLLVWLEEYQGDRQQLQIIMNLFGQLIVRTFPIAFRQPHNHDYRAEQWAETLATITPDQLLKFIASLKRQGHDLSVTEPQKLLMLYHRRLYAIAHNKKVDYFRKHPRLLSLDRPVDLDQGCTHLDLLPSSTPDPLQLLIYQEQLMGDRLSPFLTDPAYAIIHPRRHPEVTFPEVLRRRLAGQTFLQISEELQIKMGTLTAFWARRCVPILKTGVFQSAA